MTPSTIMWAGGITMLIGTLAFIINFISVWGKIHSEEVSSARVAMQGVFGLVAGIGSSFLVGGFIWFLIDKYAG